MEDLDRLQELAEMVKIIPHFAVLERAPRFQF